MEFPQQQKPAGDGKILYPPGVKEITDKITNDEVVKRLKVGTFFFPSGHDLLEFLR